VLATLVAQLALLVIATSLLRSHVSLTPSAWLRVQDPSTLALGVGGVLALALGAATTLGTIAALVSRTVPALRWTRPLEALAVPSVRRNAHRIAAFSLTCSAVLGATNPAIARTDDPVVRAPYTSTPVVDEPVVRGPETDTTPTTPSTTPATTATGAQPTDSQLTGSHPTGSHPADPGPSNPRPTATTRDPVEHVVVRGEHLWGIAEAQLRVIDHQQPSKSAVARYWSRLIAANRATLRSGDPNLIFPGEVIVLPDVN
jgi:hypothetical protein